MMTSKGIYVVSNFTKTQTQTIADGNKVFDFIGYILKNSISNMSKSLKSISMS